ncbi:MAG: DUF1926 domain-containing protein [candidate division Zixibacteria bacterium]|nr:DUF1926 domain-containing protein [candidate division Zixibacteria bacterium]
MPPVKFIFAVHCHQPVGNFDFVFEDSYNRCYHPFLETLFAYPDFKCCLHYTGILLEWIIKNKPEHFEMMKTMIQRQQLELLSGGYYEPIFAIIPDYDKVEQIKKLSSAIELKTGFNPRGMWLAERVWEPHLPLALSDAGIEFAVLDDTHFKYTGLEDYHLDGYYTTEEQGKSIKIFPISKFLRYAIPFKDSKVSIEYLSSYCENSANPVQVYADDAEKFGVWPGTNDLCYRRKWLSRFFEDVLNSSDSIEPARFIDVLESAPSKGNVYIPTASYAEMMEWSLPVNSMEKYQEFEKIMESHDLADRYSIFVRGGFWRSFLAKYPESNRIHKKMIWVDEKIKHIGNRELDDSQNSLLDMAIDEKLKGQCNDAYWHGTFGGLYLNNLRTALYKHLINADILLDKINHGDSKWLDINEADFHKSGFTDVLIETPSINAYLSPARGGSIFELDFKDISYNFCNTLTRRKETYHKQITENVRRESEGKSAKDPDAVISKEKGLDKYLKYDWYQRAFLVDHFFANHATIDSISSCAYPEQGDFVELPYEVIIDKREEEAGIILSRDGHVWVGDTWCPVAVQKVVTVNDSSPELLAEYRITNGHDRPVSLWFGSECNMAMLDGQSDDRYYMLEGSEIKPRNLASVHELPGVNNIAIEDIYLGVRCKFIFEKNTHLLLFPIHTVSLSEAGFEKVYQSSVVLPTWKFNLEPGQSQELIFRLKFERHK